MKIRDLYERDIYRSINGVVKADQLDELSVWQELDEFVVTRELTKHIHELVAVLLSTIESQTDAADKNGIWISGFFGSGKSHLIKVLSYLIENNEHTLDDQTRQSVDFFAEKIDDAMLFADLKRVVSSPTDTILFNIDVKADHSLGRDALLQVFLKVLNEKQGYSSDHPHIAYMERHLDERGQLGVFHSAFERAAGVSWEAVRDSWEFKRDQVIIALKEALGQSEESVEKWVDGGEEHFSLTVENFAKWVKRYLDGKEADQRIMFLVDEVGQFIGNDTHLMLNLQTITEQLGTICNGRAWVVVTSQEDLDAVLGDLDNANQQDFSKIQGRFKTRLSLSSANVDEVIKKRLLTKKPEAMTALSAAYEGKEDILKNQLAFLNAGMSFNSFVDDEDFADCYPFAVYQFTLVQKVFESIRKAGATGLHIAKGERSILDAFQRAAKGLGDREIGALAPFYRFYPSVEGFLDTAVKRTIDQAGDNPGLEEFDVTLLKVLFLIRYIDELPGSVDNLVTLCVDEIDTDKLALRKTIEASLARLEGQTLIARNDDLYFFLTNEERDIGREIKNVAIPSGAEERELGKLIFEDMLGDLNKHTYSLTGRDFNFTRFCDDHAVGNAIEGSLEVAFTSPLGDQYGEFCVDENCCMHTNLNDARVLVRLPDEANLGRELRTYLQTDNYVKTKQTGTLPETTKRILRDRSDENRARRSRMVTTLKTMLEKASYFASGQLLEIQRSDPKHALGDALEYLIQNAYPKMGFIEHLHPSPKQEIQSILRADDVEQAGLGLDAPEANGKALSDLRAYIQLCAQTNRQIVLYDVIEKRYGRRPYGWPELEVVLLVARLAVLREINIQVNAAPLPLDQAYDHLTASSKQRKVVITLRESADSGLIKQAQTLGQELFAQQGPGNEEALFGFLRERLVTWHREVKDHAPLARTGQYPGQSEIEGCIESLQTFVEETDSLRFLKCVVEQKNDLLDLFDDLQEIKEFYSNQRPVWESLRAAVDALKPNQLQLDSHSAAGPAFARMKEILDMPRPYNVLHEAAGLIHTAQTANDEIVSAERSPAIQRIQDLIDSLERELSACQADEALRKESMDPLRTFLATAQQSASIAHIAQAQQTAESAFDRALVTIEEASKPAGPDPEPTPKKRRIVEAKTLWTSGFIETSEDVETFIERLRRELESAINDDERVQIK